MKQVTTSNSNRKRWQANAEILPGKLTMEQEQTDPSEDVVTAYRMFNGSS